MRRVITEDSRRRLVALRLLHRATGGDVGSVARCDVGGQMTHGTANRGHECTRSDRRRAHHAFAPVFCDTILTISATLPYGLAAPAGTSPNWKSSLQFLSRLRAFDTVARRDWRG